jgi:acyl dehydratase
MVRYEDIQVGQRFAPDTFVLGRGDIDGYMRIVAAQGRAPDGEPLDGVVVASPTLAAVHIFRAYYAAYPPSPGRLHAAVEFSFLRPWTVGASITVNGVVTDKYEKRGRRYVRFELSFSDGEGNELTRALVDEITME